MTRIIFLGVFLLLSFSASAHRIYKLGVSNGLSQSSVYSLYQDRLGFLWVGTADGLNRFDGYEFRTYRFSDEMIRLGASNYIADKIAEDSVHNLYFGTTKGIGKYDFQKDSIYPLTGFTSQSSHNANTIIALKGNVLWFKDRDKLVEYDLNKNTISTYQIPGIDLTAEGFFRSVIDNQGNFWINTLYGVTSFDYNTKAFKTVHIYDHFKINPRYCYLIKIDSENNAWIVTTTGLFKVSLTDEKSILVFPDIRNQIVISIDEYDDKFYVSIQNVGLKIYDRKSYNLLEVILEGSSPFELNNSTITVSFIDKTGNLWLGIDGFGLNRLDLKPSSFRLFNSDTRKDWPLKSNFIKCFFQSGQKLYIGTHEKGLFCYNITTNTFYKVNLPPESGHTIASIKEYGRHLLLGTSYGVFEYDPESGTVLPFVLSPDVFKIDGINLVYDLHVTDGNKIIAATYYGNYFYDGSGDRILQKVKSVGEFSGFIHEDFSHTIWISTLKDGCINRYKLKNHQLQHIDCLLTGFNVRSFYEDVTNRHLWMATSNGLLDYDLQDGSYRLLSQKDGLAGNYLYAVLPGVNDELWLSSNQGLMKFHSKSGNVTVYTTEDGLQSNEFNTGARFRSADGQLYFGGINGFNWVDPASLKKVMFKPIIQLTGIKVMDSNIAATSNILALKRIILAYVENSVTFDFSALEYSDPERTKYAYYLEGIDHAWVDNGNRRTARYTQLPPGNYNFYVKAINKDGIQSDQQLLITISVLNPWWLKWYLIVAELIFLALIIFVAFRMLVNRKLKEKQRELEKIKAIQAERERISRDMHDDIGSGLSKISIMSQLIHNELPADIREVQIKKIADTAGELVDSMSNIVWTLNPVHDSLESLLSYIRQYISEIFEHTNTIYQVDYQEKYLNIELPPHIRKSVFLVIKEAANNTLKYASAKEFGIIFNQADGVNYFRVWDNGIGFNMADTRILGNGLTNMKKRIEEIGGRIDIKSQPGNGTSIILSFPLAIAN